MILHTYQPLDFDITKEVSDYTKSDHYAVNGCLKDAYDWLFTKLPTSQVIWCYPADYFPYHPHGDTSKQWTLNVPEKDAIAFLNRDVWDSIISNWYHIPLATYKKWDKEYKNLNNPAVDYDEFTDLKIAGFKNKHGPNWNEKCLFRKKLATNYRPEILIPSPVKQEWVVDTTILSFYNTDQFISGGTILRNDEDADRFIEVSSSFLRGRKIEFTIKKERRADGDVIVTVDRQDDC